MTLFDELSWRGLVSQTTHADLGVALERERFTVYCGFDPTAESLHIGSLVPIIGLMHFQRAGHRVIALLGGGTAMIGDPSFKSEERKLLSNEQVARNLAGCEAQLRRFLSDSGDNPAVYVNNGTWLGELRLVDFLRDIGKHFSVNAMIAKDSVRARLEDREHGISFTEFTYQLLQAYDFLELYDRHGCRLQIGGSDQWGNIVAGMDLTRRMREGAVTFGLTFPLVVKSDGVKFGKTESGNVWLDPARTSPYKFYQFWLNQPDEDVVRYLKYFTFLPRETIEALEAQVRDEPHMRAAQRALAEEVTRLVHGETALAGAVKASRALFGGELTGLDEATLADVFSEAPSSTLPATVIAEGRALVDVLVEAGVFPSKGEARRLVKSGGLYVNNLRIDVEDTALDRSMLLTDSLAVVRKGKKHYHLLRFE
jgi:tyrosyl-tRNA synthetase